MLAFVATAAGFASRIDAGERAILARLVDDVADLISQSDGSAGLAQTGAGQEDRPPSPADPALVRLFPPMSISDPDLAVELRALTVDDVRRSKLLNLEAVARALAEGVETVVVKRGEEGQWLTALTDIRLVVAARLGIEDEVAAERMHELAIATTQGDVVDADERTVALASLYSGVTWWQESLLRAVTPELPAI